MFDPFLSPYFFAASIIESNFSPFEFSTLRKQKWQNNYKTFFEKSTLGCRLKLFILLLLFSVNAFAVCDTVISRTNSSPNTVLTSTKYNLDLNTVYSRVNELPGDCVTDGTIGPEKLTEADFAPLLEGIKEGCFATRSDANTISINKCIISVSGNLIKKTTATTVTWGCSGCSSEVASTTYYVYATDASTLALKISTSVPDAFGYNGAERVLASFYNNASSDIDSQSVGNWVVNGFTNGPFSEMMKVPGVSKPKTIYYAFGGASATLAAPTECTSGTCVEVYDSHQVGSPPTRSGAGVYTNFTIADGTFAASSFLDCRCEAYDVTVDIAKLCRLYFATADQTWLTNSNGGAVLNLATSDSSSSDAFAKVTCEGSAP